MVRTWISAPLGRTGIRIGRSISDYDLRPRLPGWRRYELRKQLQDAATSRGEVMKKADADYVIDKSLATGGLDSNVNLFFKVKGNSASEMAIQIVEVAALWGLPITSDEALKMASDEIDRIEFWRAVPRWIAVGAAVIVLVALIWANVARADQYGVTSPAYSYDQEYRDCAWPDDGSGRRYHPGHA